MQIEKPILKWVGGKTQILSEVINSFPISMHNYYEPFLGGGSVLLALLTHRKNKKINVEGAICASDLNPDLINMYKNIQTKPEEVIKELKELKSNYFEQYKQRASDYYGKNNYYYRVRNEYNNMKEDTRLSPLCSARFIFLNKTCFRCLYRENSKGLFNAAYGHYNNPEIFNEEHIRQVSELIKRVKFSCLPFSRALDTILEGDFIYLDPPYVPLIETSFTKYTQYRFDLKQHNLLFRKCKDMTNDKVKFVLSNSNTKLVRESFISNEYDTEVILCNRKINSKKPDSIVEEVLISNF